MNSSPSMELMSEGANPEQGRTWPGSVDGPD